MLILFLGLYPVIQRRILSWNRQRQMSAIESERESRVILLVHRQESLSLLGIPLMRYIDMNDSEEVLRAIHMTGPEVPLDMVLHTPGGMVLPSLQIARALKHHPGQVTVFVPHLAMSGGTLIALAADEIIMAPHATMGPVDPQIQQYPAASIRSVVGNKPIQNIDDETLIMADVSRKALCQMEFEVRMILPDHLDEEDADRLARLLTQGTWTHDYPLDIEMLREFGIAVSTEMPENVYNLMSLYPQPTRQQAVEYTELPSVPPNARAD